MTWQRARRPEQKQERQVAILDAAAALFSRQPIAEITISDIAAGAGLAKGSVYSYFASKEEVLLGVMIRELADWFAEIDAALEQKVTGTDDSSPPPGPPPTGAAGQDDRPAQIAGLLCAGLCRRALLCGLLAHLFLDIEEHVSLDAAQRFKASLLARVSRTGAAIEAALPALPEGMGGRFLLQFSALGAGLWPMAHPAGPMRDVLAQPEMAPLRVDFATELQRATTALLRGLAAPTIQTCL